VTQGSDGALYRRFRFGFGGLRHRWARQESFRKRGVHRFRGVQEMPPGGIRQLEAHLSQQDGPQTGRGDTEGRRREVDDRRHQPRPHRGKRHREEGWRSRRGVCDRLQLEAAVPGEGREHRRIPVSEQAVQPVFGQVGKLRQQERLGHDVRHLPYHRVPPARIRPGQP